MNILGRELGLLAEGVELIDNFEWENRLGSLSGLDTGMAPPRDFELMILLQTQAGSVIPVGRNNPLAITSRYIWDNTPLGGSVYIPRLRGRLLVRKSNAGTIFVRQQDSRDQIFSINLRLLILK